MSGTEMIMTAVKEAERGGGDTAVHRFRGAGDEVGA
jgi:hypothetical protein